MPVEAGAALALGEGDAPRNRPAALLLCSTPASAQDREVPYWASLRGGEVRCESVRARNFPIEWIYRRQGLPVKVLRCQRLGGWSRIPPAREGGSTAAC
jgi:SH3-like domain-containing protein